MVAVGAELTGHEHELQRQVVALNYFERVMGQWVFP